MTKRTRRPRLVWGCSHGDESTPVQGWRAKAGFFTLGLRRVHGNWSGTINPTHPDDIELGSLPAMSLLAAQMTMESRLLALMRDAEIELHIQNPPRSVSKSPHKAVEWQFQNHPDLPSDIIAWVYLGDDDGFWVVCRTDDDEYNASCGIDPDPTTSEITSTLKKLVRAIRKLEEEDAD